MRVSIVRTAVLCAAFFSACGTLHADTADKLRALVGYTILDAKTIVGYRENGKKSDSFEGCNFDRTILFEDGSSLTCGGYGYQYAYRPTAIILVKTSPFQGRTVYALKLLVGDEVFDMQALVK